MATTRAFVAAAVIAVLGPGCSTDFTPEGDTGEEEDAVEDDAGGEVLPDMDAPDTAEGEEPADAIDVVDLVEEDTALDTAVEPDATDVVVDDVTIDDVTIDDVTVDDVVVDDVTIDDVTVDDVTVDDVTVDDVTVEPDVTDVPDVIVPCVDPIVHGTFVSTTGWTATGSAVVAPTTGGYLEVGEGQFSRISVCALGTLYQSVTVPPIVPCGTARLTAWGDVLGSSMGGMGTQMGASIGGKWHLFEPYFMFSGTWRELSVCLGEAAYASPSRIVYSPAYPPPECSYSPTSVTQVRIDDVTIDFDPACPDIGEVTNGDLEAGTGFGWTAWASSGATATAAAAGRGVGGSWGAQFILDWGCESASLSAPMSVPSGSTMANPALVFQANLTSGQVVQYGVDGLAGHNLAGTGVFREVRLCLPPLVAGSVHGVKYSASFTGSCVSPAGPLDLVVDNLGVVSDTACRYASGALDPGFESSPGDKERFGWSWEQNNAGWGGTPTAEALNDPTRARTGSGVAHLSIDQHCDSAAVAQTVTVPSPTLSAGPAIVVYYQYPVSSESSLGFAAYAFGSGVSLASVTGVASTAWRRQLMCLPPVMAGRPVTFKAGLDSSGSCALLFSTVENVWIDDFEVTTDSSCPTT